MSYEEIKQALKRLDIFLSDIARALNVSRSHVYQIAKGNSKSKRVAEAICKCLNKPLHEVFGETYLAENKIHRHNRSKQIAHALQTGDPVPVSSFA
ncbi:helix-turn-helix transcriptional regulator [Pseudoalteromonas rubra]|uniref:helix-turn-helix transcriptional regulator n=1 Tax=Pseudoalteromonas rubra TaxID=43658 RepID=UPI003AEF84F3